MKKVITSYSKLPEAAQDAFDVLYDSTDMQIISIPNQGRMTKGFLFAFDEVDYVVRLEEPPLSQEDVFKRELENVEDTFDKDVFDEEEE